MKGKNIIAIIMAIVIIVCAFAACSSSKETEETVAELVTNESGEAVTDENGEYLTTMVNKSETTTKDGPLYSSSDDDSESAKTTASGSSNNNSGTTKSSGSATTKKQTTTKKETTTKKVTTTKKETTTKKVTTTQVSSRPLTQSEKNWVIDNWFGEFPQYGAEDGFKIVEMDDENGLTWSVNLSQDNYEYLIGILKTDTALANGCTRVDYYWKDTSTESILYYFVGTN